MSKKTILLIILILALLYPGYSAILIGQLLEQSTALSEAESQLNNYRISIWVSWIVIVGIAIYYKWTQKKDAFFKFTYIYLLVAFAFYGYYAQSLVNNFDLATRYEDNYSLGVFTALENLFAPVLLTIFLQACVWWFTRRLHRK